MKKDKTLRSPLGHPITSKDITPEEQALRLEEVLSNPSFKRKKSRSSYVFIPITPADSPTDSDDG